MSLSDPVRDKAAAEFVFAVRLKGQRRNWPALPRSSTLSIAEWGRQMKRITLRPTVSRSCLPQRLNGPYFAIYLKQVCKLAGVSSVVDPGSLLFRCRDQLLLLLCFSSLIQPGIIRLSRFMDGLVQMLLTDLVPLTFLFEPAQDFLQLPREEFLHLIASWLSPERIALVETLPGRSEQIPKAVSGVVLFNDIHRAKPRHVVTGNSEHCAKVCLVAFVPSV